MPITTGDPKYLYVVESECGRVKIGISRSPHSRALTISRHSPSPVRLIAKWRGTGKEEEAIHRRFTTYRSHNEWFRIEGEVAAFVAAVFGRGLDEPAGR